MRLDHHELIGTWGSEPHSPGLPRNSRVLRIEKTHVENHHLIGLDGVITLEMERCKPAAGPAKYGFVLNERRSDSTLRFIANEKQPDQRFRVVCEWGTLTLNFLDQLPDVVMNIDPEYRFIEIGSSPDNYFMGRYRRINPSEALLAEEAEVQLIDDGSKEQPMAEILVKRYDKFLAGFGAFWKD